MVISHAARRLLVLAVLGGLTTATLGAPPRLEVEQVTFGPSHHFFGYIGHAGTVPWNASGRFILALRTGFQDHMPRPDEAAEIVLIDTQQANRVRVVEHTRAWNFQQGTMFYWDPRQAEMQFFFNDRDPATGEVFCVLFDILQGRRIREYRFPRAPIGNSGVAQKGGAFLALNYGRLHRLRPVTGYPEALDWTRDVKHPANDGLFRVDVSSGDARLLVSYGQLADVLRRRHPEVAEKDLFLNHTLWNRDDDRIFFYARADFETNRPRFDVLFVVDPDGRNLTMLPHHLGGHVDWAAGHRLIGSHNGRVALYDTDRREFLGPLAASDVLPGPDGDKALSPAGDWLVNGYREEGNNVYAFFRQSDATAVRSRRFDVHEWLGGPLRVDPAPCWNRDGTQILFPAIADDPGRTRQLFLIRMKQGQ